MVVLVYIDDISVTVDKLDQMVETKEALNKSFKMKGLGELKYFIRIEFPKCKERIVIHQRKYALEIISKTGLSAAKPAPTLFDVTKKLTTIEYNQYISGGTR